MKRAVGRSEVGYQARSLRGGVMSGTVRSHVALGSNLGDRAEHLAQARSALDEDALTRVVAASCIWETAPVGPPGQGEYLNAVIAVDTAHAPRALLDLLLETERRLGRDRARESVRWGPRVIDLDLLLYGEDRIDEPGLEVPHPRLHERPFVLEPLCEIAGARVHPTLGGTLDAHLSRCGKDAGVRRWEGSADWVVIAAR